MPPEAGAGAPLRPLPPEFLERLTGQRELLVSSRDGGGEGTVRMWFALVDPGHVLLLTPSFSLKAQRWADDPWVRLRLPGLGAAVEGEVEPVGWELASQHLELLLDRFALAGAVTAESLRWMLTGGDRLLLRVGLAPARPPGSGD
ncbi:MAG: hypothetical protein ACRENV_02800 [Candidatus Dormibacteria bacterium]